MKQKVKEPESLKMLKEAFKVLDCSGDGLIPTEFLKLSIINTGNCSMKEVNQMMEILDSDTDGNIQLDDFHRIVIPHDSVSSSCKSKDFSWAALYDLSLWSSSRILPGLQFSTFIL